MMGSNSNLLSPKSLSVARCTGALISASVRMLVAVPSPLCALIEAPSGPEERLPVAMSEITSACGRGGSEPAALGCPPRRGPTIVALTRGPLLLGYSPRLMHGARLPRGRVAPVVRAL